MSTGQSPQNSATGTYPYYPYYNYYQAVQHAGTIPPSPMPGHPWPPGGPVTGGPSIAKRPGDDQSDAGPSKRHRANDDGDEEEDDASDNEDEDVSGSAIAAVSNAQLDKRPSLTNLSKQVATDVWRFVRPLQTRDKPAVLPPEGPNLYTKPDAPFVGCKLCSGWKTWKCIVGMTSTIRNHLRSAHRDEYERICREENLKYSGDPPYSTPSGPATSAAMHPSAYPPRPPYPGAYSYPHPPAAPLQPSQARTSYYGEPPRKGTASDVWRFLRPLETRDKPDGWTPPSEEVILSKKPEAPFVGCKLCTPAWRVWKCIDGMTSTIRVHLRKEHQETYDRTVLAEGLKQLHPYAKGFRPSDLAPQFPSPSPYTGPSQSERDRPRWATNTIATDVWYFMRGLEVREQPPNWREPVNEPILDKKPNTPFLGCKLCTQRGQWRTWKCINGMSSTIRKHLQNDHGEIYASVCKTINLKAPVDDGPPLDAELEERVQDVDAQPALDPSLVALSYPHLDKGKVSVRMGAKPKERPDKGFSTEMFLDKLVRYVVASGQPLDVVEEPEFRSLLLFLGRSLAEIDLPDRQKLAQLVEGKYQQEQVKMIEELRDSSGRVSLAVELVEKTGAPLRLAVTAHWCASAEDDGLGLKSRMIAFRTIPEHPEGGADPAIVSNVIHSTLTTFGLHNKLGVVTLGDALFDNHVRSALNQLLIQTGYQAADYLRNFLPIINDAMESGLEVLTSTSPLIGGIASDQSSELSQALLENKRYLEALGRNPISRAHDLVSALADSPDRLVVLEELKAEEGEESGAGGLLQEDGRWSAKYLMIERLMALQPVVSRLLKDEEQAEIAHYALDDAEAEVLNDIKEFLRCAFAVHEMVGEEKLPLAVMAVPLYEQLLTVLKEFQQSLPELNSAISVAATKLEEALIECRKSDVYSLAISVSGLCRCWFCLILMVPVR
ncbi:hypothetical protein OE88DRAFT_495207 [Heliocybe sulcata]|uniref:BED-type domain-containing protein n=1 Tax=Heliocybe sulcata TaxID=5364 RepID=A0A5C3MV77_9AGAM|nr:hypothetical protein OE88DRAFT_495207 [Heliocybe sulcata]